MRKTDAGLWEIVVDGRAYEFEKWGAEESLDVLLDISAIVGGPLGAAVGKAFSPGGQGIETDFSADMVGQIVDQLMKNLRKDVVKPLVRKLTADKVICDGRKVAFNTHYQDDLFHMFKVLKAALEVQYGGFFAAVQDAAGFQLKKPRVATIPA